MNKNNAFALAAATLMSATQIEVASAADWSQELSTFSFKESDNRVTDTSIKYAGKGSFNDGDTLLNLDLGVDVLTGASPTGALPSDGTTTVITSPSGGKTTTNTSSKLDKASFKDKRYSFSIGVDRALKDTGTRANLGASYSKENDYKHLGISSGLSHEFNQKNTTLSAGIAYSSDTINPVGGTPTPLTTKGTLTTNNNQSKKTTDFIVGATQVLSKNAIAQANYGISRQTGYLNDPYKLISVIDSNGKLIRNLHESRPNTRLGHNLYGALKYSLPNKNVITSTARLHTDDWGINSVTSELKYRMQLANKNSIEPYIRFYHQTSADFYNTHLVDKQNTANHASADYRLAEMSTYTVGATYRMKTSSKKEWSLTGEFYKQVPGKIGFGEEENEGGSGKSVNNPGFNAFMLSLGVKF